MRLKGVKLILLAIFAIVVFIAIMRFYRFYKNHLQATQCFLFVRDLSEFSLNKSRLPSNINEFCQSTLDDEGNPVWSAEGTRKRFRFLWTTTNPHGSKDTRLIEVIEPELEQYEDYMNQQLMGRIPSNIIHRSLQ